MTTVQHAVDVERITHPITDTTSAAVIVTLRTACSLVTEPWPSDHIAQAQPAIKRAGASQCNDDF